MAVAERRAADGAHVYPDPSCRMLLMHHHRDRHRDEDDGDEDVHVI
jgi:hypothetical protein